MTANKVICLALVLVLGATLLLSSPAFSQNLITQALKIFGIGYVVSQFGGEINDFVNNLAGQHGVQWEGATMLAEQWANNLRVAFGGQPMAYATTGAAGAPSAQKIVPILSIGTGVRVGGAQVTGPSNYVDQVKAVAQIQGDFGSSVWARVLVPVSTENVVQNISRVPQTSVTALVDIGL